MAEPYLVRAKLEFGWEFEERENQKFLKRPSRLPVEFGLFRLDQSPNFEFYLMDLGWLEPDYKGDSHPDWEYPVSLLYVETKVEVQSGLHPQSVADDILEQLEAMLRLFQGGEVCLRRHEYMWHFKERIPKLALFFRYRPIKAEPATLYSRGVYRMDDETLGKFIDFFNRYWDIIHQKPQPLYNAAFRFSSSYEKRTLADRLVELVITLEALFGDRSDSLTYKIALRCSSLLYPPSETREKVFKAIKKVYADRSAIVHGERLDSKYSNEEIDQLEDYIRRSMLKFLEQYKKGNPITSGEELDELLFFRKG